MLILLSSLVFAALCIVGLLTLIRQAIDNSGFAAPGASTEDVIAGASMRSKDAERRSCGQSCT